MTDKIKKLLHQTETCSPYGNVKYISRLISLVENEVEGYEDFLSNLPQNNNCKIIGITGPPGAGKSTLTDSIIESLVYNGKKIAVICVDPSSPFNFGALLGDRIRMNQWYNNPNVFIRSLASRGSLGGLNPKIIEITDVLKTGNFDYIIIETVGVGQSEVEIAGIADTTIVVLVPESGDDIQTMKAGLMEIADVFVVNKSDRPGAERFTKNLTTMLSTSNNPKTNNIPVIKTIASQKVGIDTLCELLSERKNEQEINERKIMLLTEKAYLLIQYKRMKNINKQDLKIKISSELATFNLYNFVSKFV